MIPLWREQLVDPVLVEGDVHIWRASLNQPASHVESLQQTLAPGELTRAERCHFESDRQRFIVARGLLRAILSRYVHEHPSYLRFCSSPYGKPTLVTQPDREMLKFNLSHSSDLVLYAVTRGCNVGIDVERIRPIQNITDIAKRFFSLQEFAMFRTIPEHLQLEAFFTCWTRKEAYIKARGEGLSLPLNQFDVSFIPGEPAVLLKTLEDPQEVSRWSLHALPSPPGYEAALAVERQTCHLSYWEAPAKG